MIPESQLPDLENVASLLRTSLVPRDLKDMWPYVRRFFDQPVAQASWVNVQEWNQLIEDTRYLTTAFRYAGDIVVGDPAALADWDQDFSTPDEARERALKFAMGIYQFAGNVMLGMQMGAEAAQISPLVSERMAERLTADIARMVGARGRPFDEQKRLYHVLTVDWLTRPMPFMARYVDSLAVVGGSAYPVITAKLHSGIQHVETTEAKLSRHQSGSKSLDLVQGDLPIGREVQALMTTMARTEQFGNALQVTVEDEQKPRPLEHSVAGAAGFLFGDYGNQECNAPNEPFYNVTINGKVEKKTTRELKKAGWNDDKILTDPAVKPRVDFDPLKPDTNPFEPGSGCICPGERLTALNPTDADEFGSRDYRNFLLRRACIDPTKILSIDMIGTDGERLDRSHPRVAPFLKHEQGGMIAVEALSVREYQYRKIALNLHMVLGSAIAFDPGYRCDNGYDALWKGFRFDQYAHKYTLLIRALRELLTGAYSFLPSDKEGYMPIWAAVKGGDKIPKDWRLHHRNPLDPENTPVLQPIRDLSKRAQAEVLDTFFAHRPKRTNMEWEHRKLNDIVLAAENGKSETDLMALTQKRRSLRVDAIMNGYMSEVMDVRSRQQMWAMVQNLPEEVRQELKNADFKDYLASMGYPNMNLDSVEYRGILGLFKAVDIHDWRSVRWDQKDALVIKWWKYLNDHAEHIQRLIDVGRAVVQALDPSILHKIGLDPEFIKSLAAQKSLGGTIQALAERKLLDDKLAQEFRTNKVIYEFLQQLTKSTLEASEVSFVGPMGQRALMLDLVLYIHRLVNGYVAPIIFEGMARGAPGHERDTMGEHGSKAEFLEVLRTAPHYAPLRKALLSGGDHLVENGLHDPYVTTGDKIPGRRGARDESGTKLLTGVVHPLAPYGHRGDFPEAAIQYVLNVWEDATVITSEEKEEMEKLLHQEVKEREEALARAKIGKDEAQYQYLIPL